MKRRKTLAQLKAMYKRLQRLDKKSDAAHRKHWEFEGKFAKLLDESTDNVANMYCYWEDVGNTKMMKRYAKELQQLEKL